MARKTTKEVTSPAMEKDTAAAGTAEMKTETPEVEEKKEAPEKETQKKVTKKRTTRKKAEPEADTKPEKKEEVKAVEPATVIKETKTEKKPAQIKEEKAVEKPEEKKPATKKRAARKKTEKEPAAEIKEVKKIEEAEKVKEVTEVEEAKEAKEVTEVEEAEKVTEIKEAEKAKSAEEVKEETAETKKEEKEEAVKAEEPEATENQTAETVEEVESEPVKNVKEKPVVEEMKDSGPRRSIAFIGSECYPFVKTGGLGDVMYALPKILARLNCDVKVILPRYRCIPQKYQEKMKYMGHFQMNLCRDGKQYYVGIMEYMEDGVVYDFIDNDDFFSYGNPYTNLVDDIPRFCYFGKAALAALNYLNWSPDVIHCHDWQAALVPIYLHTMFEKTQVGRAKTVFTIHNLRFQGVYNIETIKYWSGLPGYVFNKDVLVERFVDANMLKGGLTYCNMITTVSNTYAGEIQSREYGEGLDAHLRYHSNKLRGIVNGIDCDIWNPATDPHIAENYTVKTAVKGKKKNKLALQKALGLVQDDHKFVIGLVSRLTNQKGLDLVNAVLPQIMDDHTQVVVLGTGDAQYENAFRYYENKYKGRVCGYIAYNEDLAHQIYAGCDALLVPSCFEPCGLTQLISMRYGAAPIVRETGGLKDTVEPYNKYINSGNGFTFDRYDAYLLYDAINRAKTLYFTERDRWDELIVRDMEKDVSWEKSARQYKNLYLDLTGHY